MTRFIKNPINHKQWDPSKGDYFSESVIQENLTFKRKKKRKRVFIGFLTILHIALLTLILVIY